MSFKHTIRPSLSRFTFAFLGLALAVFTWGLGYKLSLYDPPQASSHLIPTAKLLSQEEQAIAAKHLVTSSAKAPTAEVMPALFWGAFLFLLLASGAQDLLESIQKRREVRLPWRLRFSASFSSFFFRPPPVLA